MSDYEAMERAYIRAKADAEAAERQLADMRGLLVGAETQFHIIADEAAEDRIQAKARRFENQIRAALAAPPSSASPTKKAPPSRDGRAGRTQES